MAKLAEAMRGGAKIAGWRSIVVPEHPLSNVRPGVASQFGWTETQVAMPLHSLDSTTRSGVWHHTAVLPGRRSRSIEVHVQV